jgi:NAD(P)-dependent dehydrogenase (short-subunit alcohol dehydrogenase family)
MDAPLDVDMAERVAVVTGATGGIGKEIARGLARMDATVVIGARDRRRGDATADELAGGARVHAMELDVADIASIRAFAAAFRERFGELHVLVNNAGAWFSDRRESTDGYELTFATNVLGPHLLTELLLDPLRAAGRARVVNIVSAIAGHYDATDLQFTRRRFDGYQAYAQSKAALRMLTWELAARLAGTGVTANAAAPGFVRSDFNRNAHGLRATMINVSARLFAVSPAKGADTPLWVATAPALDGVTGRYFDRRTDKDGGFAEPDTIADLDRRCREMER